MRLQQSDIVQSQPNGISSIDDLVIFEGQLKQVAEAYNDRNLEHPDWLIQKTSETKQVLANLLTGRKQRQLRELKLRLDSLKTPDEKRKAVEVEIGRLEKELGLAPVVAPPAAASA
jgi:hypothetical protein